jgi:2-amino-4-hydroxy-6-hydroxymethyldihydropteridine diphosphokinase
MKYFLSIGSNIDAKKNLDFAYKELKNILDNIQSSAIYTTKAEGFVGDDFLNSIICGSSNDNFEELNVKLKMIEDKSGRDRSKPKFSARTLDIDIVLQINDDEEILFESDEIEKYSFVSDPLKELL